MARKPGKTAQENTANEAKRVRSVSVIDVLGGKGGIPSNLVVEIRSQSKQGVTKPRWQARWILPSSFLPPLKPGEKRHQHTRRTTGLEATDENLRDA